MNIIFSLATISDRKKNLNYIIDGILNQCDLIFVNLVGYDKVPSILKNDKIIVNQFEYVGSEIRFYNYNDIPDDSYYFTIDDDIYYPKDYSKTLIKNMKMYENNVVCCVHGSNIDKSLNNNYYKKNRDVFHFKEKTLNNIEVMIPGVGTSCFYKKNTKLNINDYKVRNMSDTYTGCLLAKQGIKRISIKREKMWLRPLNEFYRRIHGNNPYQEIDRVINENKNYL
jgi:hypothetical protein